MIRTESEDATPESYLPLTPATFQILLALVDGERHGYAIMRAAIEGSDGQVRPGPGTLYGSLKRLLEGGLVAESGERVDPEMDDERRRYYRLTEFGMRVARAEARRMASVLRTARQKKLLTAEPT